MQAFLASDAGLLVAWLLLALALADILIGGWWLLRGNGLQQIAREFPALRRRWLAVFLAAALSLDAWLFAVGLWGLRLHGLW